MLIFILACQMVFMLGYELFIPFDIFSLQYRLKNVFNMSKIFNIIGLRWLYSFS